MATVVRVRRLVNPRTRRAKGKRRRPNPSRHRRRLTPAQIKAGFGGKRAQAGLRGSRKRKRAAGAKSTHRRRKSNPKTRVVTKTRYRTRTKVKYRTRVVKVRAKASSHRRRRSTRRRNPGPALLVTYGPALNPKRRTHVAKHRKRRRTRRTASNPRRRARARVSTKVRYRTRARRSNPRRRHHFRSRRRNPSLISGGLRNMGTAVVGGLVGVTVTKTVPGMLAGAMPTLVGNPLMNIVVSAATAWGAGELASKFVGPEFGKYVFFGGLMQAGSLALNMFLPSIGSVVGLSGMRGVRGLTPSGDILLPHNMFAGMGSRVASPGPMRGGSGFTPAFAN